MIGKIKTLPENGTEILSDVEKKEKNIFFCLHFEIVWFLISL